VLVVLRVTHVSIVISIDVREVTEDVDGAAGVARAQGRAYVERTNAPETSFRSFRLIWQDSAMTAL
jgi:hypothetical protein